MDHELAFSVRSIADSLASIARSMAVLAGDSEADSGEGVMRALGRQTMSQVGEHQPVLSLEEAEGNSFYRQPLPGNNWLLCQVDAEGEILDMSIELEDGQRIAITK